MKRLGIIFVILLFIPAIAYLQGCDGDGDGDGGAAPAGTGVSPGTGQQVDTTVALDSGTTQVPVGVDTELCVFNITQPGTVEGKLEWTVGPPTMHLTLMPLATLHGIIETGSSSLYVRAELTQQDLDDEGTQWALWALNTIGPDAEVKYRVYFTPD